VKARRHLLALAEIIGGGTVSPAGLHACMPEINVQPIDLLDEHQNCATDGGKLLAPRLS
jgi:hypothetical protein